MPRSIGMRVPRFPYGTKEKDMERSNGKPASYFRNWNYSTVTKNRGMALHCLMRRAIPIHVWHWRIRIYSLPGDGLSLGRYTSSQHAATRGAFSAGVVKGDGSSIRRAACPARAGCGVAAASGLERGMPSSAPPIHGEGTVVAAAKREGEADPAAGAHE